LTRQRMTADMTLPYGNPAEDPAHHAHLHHHARQELDASRPMNQTSPIWSLLPNSHTEAVPLHHLQQAFSVFFIVAQ
jgi:hypothetical protein